MILDIDGEIFEIDIDEDELLELTKETQIRPCYVPGNFPWKARC